MAYNEDLAFQVREILADQPGVIERKMFGGLCFMVDGNMCCGISNDDLMVRVGPAGQEEALAQPNARPMDLTGRTMLGFVLVGGEAAQADQTLTQWVQRGLDFAKSLPAK